MTAPPGWAVLPPRGDHKLRRRDLLVLGPIAAGLPAAFAQQLKMPRVDVHTDPHVDLSKIETYGWKDSWA